MQLEKLRLNAVSNFDKFAAELKREVTTIASNISEVDWHSNEMDVKQLGIYLEELDDGNAALMNNDGDFFYSSSGLTYFETDIAATKLHNRTIGKWQLNLDFIRVVRVDTLLNVNEWEIHYDVLVKDDEINLLAIVKNGLVEIKNYTSNYDDKDFELYTDFEHYRLLAILKQ